MDYKKLLKKYIEYVTDCEGCDFIDPIDHRFISEVEFTKEEWGVLEGISAQIEKEWEKE
jgi:hypothetical protein